MTKDFSNVYRCLHQSERCQRVREIFNELEDFLKRFEYLLKHNDQYFTIVIEDVKKQIVVGAGTIFVERKFVHHNGLVGHIEDIVTHSEYRGFNLGRLVVNQRFDQD